MTTVLTCYSSVNFANVAITECAATARRRKRDIVIDDAPPTHLKNQKEVVEADMNEQDEESGVNTYKNIRPSRTVKAFSPMMTKDSNNIANMNVNNNEDEIPFIPSLEVIKY